MFIHICVMHGHGLGKTLFNIILYLRLGLPSGSCLQVSPPKLRMLISSPQCPAHLVILYMVT